MLKLYDLKTEYRDNPLGLDEQHPAFSWKLRSDHRDVRQASCRIRVSSEGNSIWDSGIVATDRSLYHSYNGPALKPKTLYDVTVSVTDNTGEQAELSGWFETGLLDPSNMEADWITHDCSDELEPCPVFVREFRVDRKLLRARAYVSALGVYKMELNGKRVGDAVLAPGWTSYQERLQYQTYDLTDELQDQNRLEITVGNGWYKGVLGFYGQGCNYGKRVALIAQLELIYSDGTTERICTDERWFSTTGPRRFGELYHGEIIDRTLEPQALLPVRRFEHPKSILIGQINEPVRITQRVPVREVIHAPNGEILLDFGQNLAGVVEARLSAPRGTTIVLRHGETLDENGNLFTVNLRKARATDTFICSGGDDVFLPEFTYHGFRYVCVEGLDQVDPACFTACVLHTGFARSAEFRCADPDITRLWQNVDWTMRSNFLDLPTDCPQRDERLGYTGDTEIFLPTAVFCGDVALTFRKWLRDLCVEQTDEFGVPLTVPDILRTRTCVSIWHEAATIVPWVLYQNYGDLRLLEEQYDSMARSVEYTRRLAGERGLLQVDNSTQFGDWLALDAPKGPFRQPTGGEMRPSMTERSGGTDNFLVGNVYYLYSIDIMAKTAELLGKNEDAASWRALYETVRALFRKEYVTAAGRLVTETQTAAALALYFDLVAPDQRERVLQQLRLNLIQTNKHLYTGFVGTEYLPHVLSDNGLHQLMGEILRKDDCPSWLYGVRHGATTIWELWDGKEPDGKINPFEMNSFNQFGFGSVGNWLMTRLAGLTALEPGWRKSRIAPRPVTGIPSLHAAYETPYGRLACDFVCKDGQAHAELEIPANTRCVVALPGREAEELGSGSYEYDYALGQDFEEQPFSENSTPNQLLSHSAAKALFEEKAPDLARNSFLRNFAGRLSVEEVKLTLPKTLVPQRAIDLYEEMIDLLNQQAKAERSKK